MSSRAAAAPCNLQDRDNLRTMSDRVQLALASALGGALLAATLLRRKSRGSAQANYQQTEVAGRGLLDGRSVVVTGGSSGIGRAICLACAREGANVVILDPRSTPLEGGTPTEQAIVDLCSAGNKVRVQRVSGDCTAAADIERAIAQAVAFSGRLDVYVNNAAIDSGGKDLLATDEATWDRVMRVNAKGVFLGCQGAVRAMLQQEPRAGSETRTTAALLGRTRWYMRADAADARCCRAKLALRGRDRRCARSSSSRPSRSP